MLRICGQPGPPTDGIQHDPQVLLPNPPPSWRECALRQNGVISRGQLLSMGLSPAQARRDVDNGRWQTLHPGVYGTFTGPVSSFARVWAAVLYAGPGAAASHRTALWLTGHLDEDGQAVHVSIPASRRVLPQSGIRIHLSRLLAAGPAILHPSSSPPRVRLEVALLDWCDQQTASQATHLVLSAIQRRLTTANRIGAALATRTRHRWRRLLTEILGEARAGVASPLELRYRRKVETSHRLPLGSRNFAERSPIAGNWYRDVRYPPWRLIVELDGQEAHPRHLAFRDLRRDNWAAVAGDIPLRYGWRDVVGNPCAVAQQIAHVLTTQGWRGQPRRCGTSCCAAPPGTAAP